MQQVVRCLLAAKDSSEAIAELYHLRKRQDARFSLAALGKKAGINSRGYVSDLVSGRRVVSLKYADAVCGAFDLTDASSDYLKALIELDHAEGEAADAATAKLDKLRKVLKVEHGSLPKYESQQFFAFEVFCAFSLFGNRPSRAQLAQYFGRARSIDVDYALHDLAMLGLVRKEDKHYVLLKDFISFGDSENGLSHLEFLKLSLSLAMRNLEKWFPRKDEAAIYSSIIAVEKTAYQEKLKELKAYCVEWQTGLETSTADSLIRFNVQVFPNEI